MESESSGCSGWLTEFTNLPFVDFASVECFPSEMIAASFLKCGITNNLDQKINWFTIQPRTLMNLMIQASKTYLNQTLSQNLKVSLFRNALFKDTEH